VRSFSERKTLDAVSKARLKSSKALNAKAQQKIEKEKSKNKLKKN
jgi:hypothetical protein